MANGHVIEKGLNRRHLELIELMIREPELSNADLAAKLNLSESWLSTIKNSDLFQEEYRRRVEHHRLLVSQNIISKTEEVVDLTLNRMKNVLKSDDEIGLGRLAQVFDITTKRLFPEPRGASTIVNVALADPEAIRRARERADKLRTGTDGMIVDVTPEPTEA